MQALASDIPGADPSWHHRQDHPYYKPSHHRLQRFVREYVDTEIAPNVEEWERQGDIPETVRSTSNPTHELIITRNRIGIQTTRRIGVFSCVGFPHTSGFCSGCDVAGRAERRWY